MQCGISQKRYLLQREMKVRFDHELQVYRYYISYLPVRLRFRQRNSFSNPLQPQSVDANFVDVMDFTPIYYSVRRVWGYDTTIDVESNFFQV